MSSPAKKQQPEPKWQLRRVTTIVGANNVSVGPVRPDNWDPETSQGWEIVQPTHPAENAPSVIFENAERGERYELPMSAVAGFFWKRRS